MVCGRSITCIVRQWEVAVWRLCFNTPHTTTTRFISVRAALLLKSHKSTMIDSTCLLHITETRCSYKCETLLHNAPIIFFIFTFLKSSGTRPLSANFVLGSAKKKKWCWSQSGLDRIGIKHPEATFSGEPGFWFCLFNKADGEGEASQNKLACKLIVTKSL